MTDAFVSGVLEQLTSIGLHVAENGSQVRSLIPSSSISIPRLVQRRDIAIKIKELNERLQAIAKEKDDYAFIVNLNRNNDLGPERPKTTYFIDESEICGRDQDRNTIMSMLLVASNGIEEQRADCYHENARHLTVILDDEHVAIPNPIYNLKKLRTLRVDSSLLCSSLIELPIGFERLVNLRHLQNAGTYGCNSMPPGMQRLTCLQTLEEFVVSSFRGWSIKGRSNISDLGSLAHLRGNLKIIGLGNVRTENEAEDAGLRNKTGLRNLTLSFNSNSKTTRITDEASVLEALQPPPYLESLNINRMNGPTVFPSWMASLSMLKRVILWACFNWKTLPPMGKLPFLEHLEMWEMKKVKKVGEEFMGVERVEGQTSSSSSSSNNNNIAFPNLKHLKFQFMEEWEEWEFGNPSASIAHDGSSSITIMPCLHSLNIISCLKLKSLPRHLLQKTTLQSLEIFDCPILRERCLRNGTGEDWPYISHIPTITINGEDVQRYAH
ncbi:hypothetical protein SCA6_019613 [Theobroma cacao]